MNPSSFPPSPLNYLTSFPHDPFVGSSSFTCDINHHISIITMNVSFTNYDQVNVTKPKQINPPSSFLSFPPLCLALIYIVLIEVLVSREACMQEVINYPRNIENKLIKEKEKITDLLDT